MCSATQDSGATSNSDSSGGDGGGDGGGDRGDRNAGDIFEGRGSDDGDECGSGSGSDSTALKARREDAARSRRRMADSVIDEPVIDESVGPLQLERPAITAAAFDELQTRTTASRFEREAQFGGRSLLRFGERPEKHRRGLAALGRELQASQRRSAERCFHPTEHEAATARIERLLDSPSRLGRAHDELPLERHTGGHERRRIRFERRANPAHPARRRLLTETYE